MEIPLDASLEEIKAHSPPHQQPIAVAPSRSDAKQDDDHVVLKDRGAPRAMGTIRLGTSGRPFPVPSGASTASNRYDHNLPLKVKSHPRSPFGRKIELTKKLILVPEQNQQERFQVKKTVNVHAQRKIASVPRRSQNSGSTYHADTKQGDFSTAPDHIARSNRLQRDIEASREPRTAICTTQDAFCEERKRATSDPIHCNDISQRRLISRPPSIVTSFDQKSSRVPTSAATLLPSSAKSMAHDVMAGASLSLGEVDMHYHPLHISANSREFQQFTQRMQESDATKPTKKGFHVAFHGQPISEHVRTTANASSQEKPPNNNRPATEAVDKSVRTPWREIDESIDHIYEDPSVDFVQMKLLHNSGGKDKRQKYLEHKRLLAAAAQLQQEKKERLRQHDEQQRRKMQIEQLSDAIRLRNKKLFKKSDASDESLTSTAQSRAQAARSKNAVEMERKPPVPRQRGRRRGRERDRNGQLREMTDAITSQPRRRDSTHTSFETARRVAKGLTPNASVSSSILLGDTRSLPTKDVRQSIGEESHEGAGESAIIQDDTPVSNSSVHQAPARRTPRRIRRTQKATATREQSEPDPISQRQRSERRDHAREFMELQKQRRQITSARQKQTLEMEKERRRLQLETLEQERLASLRRAKKKKRRYVSIDKEEYNSLSQIKLSRHRAERETKMAHNEADIDDRMKSEPDQVDDEYISSDQENKKSSRNVRNTNESLPIFSGADHADDYDASILVNHPSNSHGSPKDPPVLQVDARLRRLLKLEEKALKLSELVSGIKSKKTRTSTFSAAPNRAEETADMNKELYLQPTLHSMEIDRSESGERLSINERRDDSVDEENRSEGEESYSDRESASNDRNGTYESEKDSSVSEQSRLSDEASSELHAMSDFQREQGLDTEEIRSPADTFMDIEVNIEKTANLDSDELDPRYIGVHNIRGEWPIERHQLDDYDIAVNRSPSSSRLSSSSSHSGGQFVEQHLSPSNRGSLPSDGSEQADSDVFEASIHTYIQQRLHPTLSALRRSTDVSFTDGPSEGKSNGLAEITAKDTTFQSIQPKQYGLRDTIALKVNDERRRTEAQEVFLKMVRDTDDSLSVINSTATKIWLEQQQRVKARMEQKLQHEQEREKEEQRMKDELLKSVMDSLWVKPDACDESDQIESYDDGNETMFKYERLEDIMQEVQKEWMLEKQERDLNVIVGSRTQASAASDEVDQMNSAVTYWNDMLTNSSPLQQSKNSLKTKASMPRTVIDTSELDQQRAQQQQLEDELTESYKNEVRRVHSPKTLARLLLAEVDYHEAIHDAHLQLTMMEQTQVVEQAHVETIHVANAFKEEMENNMTSHQIALEHAILAKQFDGDLHDVMHELENIQQTQTNEAAIASASLHLELRKANLRESTVQTDELKRVDATTNAKLHIESGTTTSPGVSDAAVQYEFPEEESINPSNDLLNQPHTRVADQVIFSNTTGTGSSAEHGYSEEDYEDENFEPASHSVVDSNHHKSSDASIAGVASSVVDEETSKSVYESDHSEAEIVSKDDDEASTSKLKQPATASDPYEDDEIYSEQSVEEGESGGSKAESIPPSEIGDAISDDEENYPSDTGGNASTSMGYDDDFEVSHQVQPVDQNVEDESFEDEDEGSPGASVTSEIDDEVGEHSGVKNSDGLVSAESKYSSEFSEDVEVEQLKSGLDISNLLPTPSHNTERAEPQVIATAVQSTRYMVEHASESLRYNAIYGSDELAQAYQRDLEMRKNSDESLLLLRLQVLEQHFQRDQLAIEEQIANANNAASSSKVHLQQTTRELVLRKEALRMAFMSEKANVESLRAASMARYYQDLISFQSLISGTTSNGNGNMVIRMPVPSSPPLDARTQLPHPSLIKQQSTQQEPAERERRTNIEIDEYDNEFDSVSDKAEAKSEGDGIEDDIQSQQSVYSEKEQEIQSQQSAYSEKEDDFDVEESAKSIVDDDVRSDASAGDDGIESDAGAKYDDDAYDDDFASVSRSEASSTAQKEIGDEELGNYSVESVNASDVAEVAEVDDSSAEIDEGTASEGVEEDQIVSDNDVSKEGEEAGENDYDDEFASISESNGTSLTQKPATDDEIEEEEEKMNDFAASDGVPSDQSSDHYSDDEMVEDHLQNNEKDQGTMFTGKFNVNDAHNEDTDEDEVSSKLLGPSKSVDAVESILVVEQSGSEDSSTTKLLVEQVNALRQGSKDPTEAEIKHIEDKIERKKIKALELIQAKERLIKQEKHKFKQEEERRQVDTLAQIALRMDVITELSKAKADIKQGLENEMKTLQQVYPTLLGANSVQLQGDVPALGVHQTQQIPNSPNKIKVAEYLTQSKASESQFAAEIEADHEKEDKYEDSFEVEQSAPDIGNEEDKSAAEEEYESSEDDDTSHYDRKVESASNASAIIAGDEDEVASDTEYNEEPERSDVESEIQSDNDGVSDDIQFDAPAGDNKLEDEIKDEEESVGGYEDEYEDETFDDAQSASFAPKDSHVKSKEYEKKEETNDNAGAGALDEDEYSDESFEKGSGSPSTHSSDDKLINVAGIHVVDDIVPQIEKADGNLNQEEQQQEHVSIGDLSTALDAVAFPLHSLPVDAKEAPAGKIEKDLSVDESNVFPSASAANLSGSISQEEILSKSIEEQTKRLEELKQMILSRKDEIVSVQKHMRIEKRREQLSAEEKLLWDKMERVEANLRLDEAALELSRQRNRLESMQLEAKHSGYKMQSKTNINVDLLDGFAYIETAEEPIAEAEIVLPRESTKKNTVWGATSDMTCQTDDTMVECDKDLDLLRGYAYVEDAEVSNFQLSSVELNPAAGNNDADELMPYAIAPAILDEPDRTDAIERETIGVATEVSGNVMGDHVLGAHVALQTEAVLDLLDGYAYIEDALQVVESEKDLLVGFDHVEGADPLSADDDCGLQSNMEPLASDVAADLAAREVEYSFGEDDECEVQHIASDDETPMEDESHSILAEPFEVSKSDHDRVQVQSEDDSDAVQSALQYQGDDETKDPEDESVLQGAEQNADIGRRASEDLVDCVTDAIYAKMFDSVMRDASSLPYRLPPSGRNLGEPTSPEVVVSRVSDEGQNTRATSKEDMQEKEHARNSVSQEQYDNSSDDSAMKTSTAERQPIIASKDCESNTEDTCCDRIAEQMFDDLYNAVVDSEVQISRKQHMPRQIEPQRSYSVDSDASSSKTNAPSTPEAAKIYHAEMTTMKKKTESEISAERELVSKIIETLDIQAGKVRLPDYTNAKRNDNSHLKLSRLVYEVVQEVADDLLFRQEGAATHSDAFGSDLLAAEFEHHVDVVELRQQVEIEMDRILSIRATGKDELACRMRNLTEEMDTSQVTREERQMMQTQFRTSVNHVADRVRLSVIVSSTEATTPATRGGTPGTTGIRMPRSFYPRTPTPASRPTSRRPMLLHTLFNHELAQVQDRITNFILDDLLQPDELGLEC